MIDFTKVLNPEQCAAATAPDGPILVLAAAGTGKTRTLVHRVAYLVERGIEPSRILLLTFTNKAAREMLERAELVVPNVGGIWSGTFHHVCARLLRMFGTKLGYEPGFQIFDEEDSKRLINDCIKAVSKNPKDFPKKEFIAKLISDAANREMDIRTVAAAMQSKEAFSLDEVLQVCELYKKRKFELGAMDFDDLLVNGLRLLDECPDVKARLQAQFQYVLVDEYQDTNVLQAKFTDILAAGSGNIMVVGDDFQCIYTWRGAQYENIMRFPERWQGCRVIKLERNYRSLAPILDFANIVMENVDHAFDKKLRPFRQGPAMLPQLYRMWDSRVQAETVVKLIAHLRSEGIKHSDIAILYRSHYTSIDIQMSLTRARVPFRITSGLGVFEQLHVKDVLAFLRLAVDKKAELSFLRLLCLFPGVGEMTARKIWTKLGCCFNALDPDERATLGSLLPSKAADAWNGVSKAYKLAVDHFASNHEQLLVSDFVEYFYANHLALAFEAEEAKQRQDDLGELASHIADAPEGIRGFLSEVALMTNLDARNRSSLPEDHLLLSTVHQAKGMEWPVVIVPWVNDTIFPSGRAVEEGNIAEERRLFYVAVTRAKDRLYLMSPYSKKSPEGGSYPVELSQFVANIPKENYSMHEVHTLVPENSGYGNRSGYGNPYNGSRGGYGRSGYGGGGYGGGRNNGGTLKTTWRR